MFLRRCVFAFAAACVCVLLAVPAQSEDWTLFRKDLAGTGFTAEQIRIPLAVSWQYNTFKSGKNTASPVVAGGLVYFCTGNRLIALDVESGARKWTFPTDEPLAGVIRAAPAVSDGVVYVGATDGNLYALNASDGKLVWSYPTTGSIRGAPAVSGNIVFFGSDNNNLYAVDVQSGELAWRGPLATRDDVTSQPVIASGYVVFVSMDGLVHGASETNGVPRWEFRLATVTSRCLPAVYSDIVYIAAGNNLQAIRLKTGRQRWLLSFSSELATGPTIGTDSDSGSASIYVITKNRKLYAITLDRKTKWNQPALLPHTASCAPIVAGDTVIACTNRGDVCAYSTATGNLKMSYVIPPAQPTVQ